MSTRRISLLCLFLFVGVFAWKVGDKISSDATSMAIGFLFGMIAGVPTAIFVMASSKQSYEQTKETNQKETERRRLDEQSRQAPATSNLFIIGSMNFNQSGGRPEPDYKEVPSTVIPKVKALATKRQQLTVETDHEWQDLPYPIVKK